MTETATLTLCMAVRDEGQSLQRAIDSARSIVDDIVIGVDERSQDDTLSIAEQAGARVFRFNESTPPNFARMRNQAMERVRTDWALILDGHEWLESPEVVRPALETSAWSIEAQILFEPDENRVPALSYLFPKIHRPHVRFVGPGIHEEVSTPPERREVHTDIKIWHERVPGQASATRSREKAGSELDVLRTAWESAGDRRALFYLANGLRDGGRYREAIAAFTEYLRAPAWEEEGWHAQLSLARCLAAERQLPEAREAFERAVLAWPERAEAVVGLGHVLLALQESRAAVAWFRMATGLPEPTNVRLFVEVPVYRWGAWHGLALGLAQLGDLEGAIAAEHEAIERGAGDWARQNIDMWRAGQGPWRQLFDVTIHSYYSGDPHAGREACERLQCRDDVPDHIRAQVRRNQIFYAQHLTEVIPSARRHELNIPVQEGWSCFNPSIATDGPGFLGILRSSNYSVDERMRYGLPADDGVVRTTNYRLELAEDLTVQCAERIADQTDKEGLSSFPVTGFEDCRLFQYRGVWHVAATVRDRNSGGICQMGLLSLDGSTLRDLTLLSNASTPRHEKNWMPLVAGDDLFFIYSCRPTVVMRYDPQGRRVELASQQDGPPLARDFRGGSQAIEVEDGYLFVVHESVTFEDGGRVCPHRFVLMRHDFEISHVSPQFFFCGRQLEFCAGLARRGTLLVASFGVRDAQAYVATMELGEVLSALRPVGRLDP